MKLDRGSYLILAIMQKCGAADFIQALTINEIAEKERISKTNTIYKKVKHLQKAGYIKEGVKVGRAKSYYITREGVMLLPEKENNYE